MFLTKSIPTICTGPAAVSTHAASSTSSVIPLARIARVTSSGDSWAWLPKHAKTCPGRALSGESASISIASECCDSIVR